MERPLRLIESNPVDELARTIEALLVIASQPLTVEELADATQDDAERIDAALEALSEQYREGRSGIVLEFFRYQLGAANVIFLHGRTLGSIGIVKNQIEHRERIAPLR